MDESLLYAGTEDGFRAIRVADGTFEVVARDLTGEAVRGIAVDPDDPDRAFVGCGLRGWGLHLTRDGGQTFETVGFEDRWVWEATFGPDGTLYVGTEPPMLYASRDGENFEPFAALADLPSHDDWFFFHEPFEAGHVHGVAIHPDEPERIFAGVEHGALVYTHDGGATWNESLVGYDLHRVAVDPDDPDRVLAGAGEGLFVSPDAGASFEAVEPLAGKYVHGVHFDPSNPDRVYAYVAADEPLSRSDDGGDSWQSIGADLPAARPADNLVVGDAGTLFYAGDAGDGSRLFVSNDAGETWTRLDGALPKVWRLYLASP